mgnify:FL=1
MPARIKLHAQATIAFMLCMALAWTNTVSGQSNGLFKKQGDSYFDQGQYRSALYAYRQGGFENTKDENLRLKIGICHYETNDPDGAFAIFTALIAKGKPDPLSYYHAAKCRQANGLYTEASAYYKLFLQHTKSHEPLRPEVIDELLRCANGNRLQYGEEIAYVENAGSTINTQFAEFGVRTSPTIIDKIYFNSDRSDMAVAKGANGNVDIYSTSLVNGRWSTPAPLPAHINTPGYDEVCGFSVNGQVLYYLTASGKTFGIQTDTFTTDNSQPAAGLFTGPYLSSHGGTDLFFFNDTICLFASDRPGGYGGYDLYVSLYTNGAWTKPANLGPSINSFYNERFPFLTKDGLTLYFSSDNLESIGGYDVFMSTYNTQTHYWPVPVNLGPPVNSPMNDTYMVLAPDGMTGYLSSDRPEGYGEADIYRVLFKQPVLAHQHISTVPTFFQYHLLEGEEPVTSTDPAPLGTDVKEFYLTHLFLDEHGEVLTPQNIKKLEVLASLLQIYPAITAELSCFELPSGQQTYNLYFSIKKAEEAAAFLAGKGISKERILLKGYGTSFPLVVKPAGASPSPIYQKLNQRLEIGLHHYENQPAVINIEKIKVPANIQDPKGVKFQSLRSGLYYSVQIASITQILQNPAMESLEELFIEEDLSQGNYLYMAGMIPTYKEAEKLLSTLIGVGFPDARIIPYVDGIRIPQAAANDFARQYPDLLFYLSARKK